MSLYAPSRAIIHAVSSCSGLGQPSEHWQRQEGTQGRLKSYTILRICCPSIWNISRSYLRYFISTTERAPHSRGPLLGSSRCSLARNIWKERQRVVLLRVDDTRPKCIECKGVLGHQGANLLHRSANTTALSIRVFSSVSITTSKEAVPRLLAFKHSAIKLSIFHSSLTPPNIVRSGAHGWPLTFNMLYYSVYNLVPFPHLCLLLFCVDSFLSRPLFFNSKNSASKSQRRQGAYVAGRLRSGI